MPLGKECGLVSQTAAGNRAYLGAYLQGNFQNADSWRCFFLDYGGKIKGIQDRLSSGNR